MTAIRAITRVQDADDVAALTGNDGKWLRLSSGAFVFATPSAADVGALASGTTTAGVPDSSNKRYVTDAELTVLAATSGSNSGDQVLPTDATIGTTDVTSNNVSTSKHGWAPKAPNDATKFLDGTAAYSVPPSYRRPAVSGQWYVPGSTYAADVHAITASLLYLSPIELGVGTLDRIGINQQGAGVASVVGRLGIYSDNGNFYPGALLIDAGTVDMSTAAAVKTITIAQAIATPGVYWVGGVQQGAGSVTVVCINGASTQQGLDRMPVASASLFGKSVAFTQSGVTGALPANFTATPTIQATDTISVAVRYQ